MPQPDGSSRKPYGVSPLPQVDIAVGVEAYYDFRQAPADRTEAYPVRSGGPPPPAPCCAGGGFKGKG